MDNLEKLNVRFCVGEASMGMGFTWRAFSNKGKSDVYVKTSGLGRFGTKFSFHQNNLRNAFIETLPGWDPNKDRALEKWSRAPIMGVGESRETPVLIVEVPTDFLSAFQKPKKKTELIKPAPKHCSTIIQFSYTYEAEATVREKLSETSDRQIIAYQRLPDDTAFLIHSYHLHEDTPPLEVRGSKAFGTIWCDRHQDQAKLTNRVMINRRSKQSPGYVAVLEIGGIKGKRPQIGNPQKAVKVDAKTTLAWVAL